eukprot:TRINITY_DN22143_c0_g1_i1.p1 TRINITY_DN22143_c0_g1~~TRINITY_DN22143_c0_g1_i1.p1  ORF type:complete len:405 (+),score=64.16 TRINITY_DN22143_c0_g1_i1:298-1512(+)
MRDTTISDLPDEILQEILLLTRVHWEISKLSRISLVSKQFYSVSSRDVFWKRHDYASLWMKDDFRLQFDEDDDQSEAPLITKQESHLAKLTGEVKSRVLARRCGYAEQNIDAARQFEAAAPILRKKMMIQNIKQKLLIPTYYYFDPMIAIMLFTAIWAQGMFLDSKDSDISKLLISAVPFWIFLAWTWHFIVMALWDGRQPSWKEGIFFILVKITPTLWLLLGHISLDLFGILLFVYHTAKGKLSLWFPASAFLLFLISLGGILRPNAVAKKSFYLDLFLLNILWGIFVLLFTLGYELNSGKPPDWVFVPVAVTFFVAPLSIRSARAVTIIICIFNFLLLMWVLLYYLTTKGINISLFRIWLPVLIAGVFFQVIVWGMTGFRARQERAVAQLLKKEQAYIQNVL